MIDSLRYGYLRGALKFYVNTGLPVDTETLARILEDAERQEL